MADKLIELDVEDNVARLTLNNPPLNLVTLELTRQLGDMLETLSHDDEVRALVLTGAGREARAFCVGSDIGEFADYIGEGTILEKKMNREIETYNQLDDFPKPTIAAINGHAFGGGLELAVCCDLLIVSTEAKLALPEVKLGVFPGSGGTIRVARRIGEGRAKEMMFTGDAISAETALSWGLANRVVAASDVLPEAMALAARIAAQPGKAVRLCKQAIENGIEFGRDEALRRSLTLIEEVFASEDCREGMRAFFAKERARFNHR